MRYSIILAPAFAAVALGQSSVSSVVYTNPFTSYLTQTNSLGVVTGGPAVNTINTEVAATSQPSVVTSQPAVATSPAGTPTPVSTFVPVVVPSSSVAGAAGAGATGLSGGSAGSGSNGTFSTGSPTPVSSHASTGSATGKGSSSASGSKTGSATASGSSSTSSSGAEVLEPLVKLGFAGAVLAAFL